MKKSLFIVTLLLIVFNLFGQGFKLKIRHKHIVEVGTGYSYIQALDKTESSPLLSAGYYYSIRSINNTFLGNIYIQTGLQLSHQFSTPFILNKNQSFVTLPVSLNYYIYNNPKFQFNIQAGLNNSFMLNNTEDFNSVYFHNYYVGFKTIYLGFFGMGIRYTFQNEFGDRGSNIDEMLNYSNGSLYFQYIFRSRSKFCHQPSHYY